MITADELILIGNLTRTHGTAGELQCRTINEYWDEAEADFLVLMVDRIPVPFRVTDWRGKGMDLLFTLDGIHSEQQALRLVGCDAYMLRRDLRSEVEEELSWQQMVGYSVNGTPITAIDDSTENILACLEDGRLIPLHEDLITDIDHEQRSITMDLPQGL